MHTLTNILLEPLGQGGASLFQAGTEACTAKPGRGMLGTSKDIYFQVFPRAGPTINAKKR